MLPLLLVLALQVPPPPAAPPQEDVDPAIRVVVERFFATQEAEDVDGYLALWSRTAQRPLPAQVKFIFENGDDRFTDLAIQRVAFLGGQARVRVAVTRVRTDNRVKQADGTPSVFNTRLTSSLTLVREEDGWRLVREGTPIDDLAGALLEAKTDGERKALLEAESDLVGERLLEAISRRGDSLAQMARYGEAQGVYERVLDIARRIGDRKGESRALQNIANALYLLRQFDGALKAYEEQLALARSASMDDSVAAALVGIGTIRYSTFEYPAALTAYREALAIQERIGDSVGVGTSLVSIGNVQFLHGNYDEAIADYRGGRELFRKLYYRTGETWALEGLGRVYTAQGNLAGALDAYTAVLEEGRARKDARGQGTALHHIGQIHLRLGNLDAARGAYEQARTFFETLKDQGNVGFAWQGIALTELVAGRFAAAAKAYVQSQADCTAAGEHECAANAIVGLAFAQSAQEHFDEAIATYHKGIEAFVKLEKPEETARAEIGLSQALFGKKDYGDAVKAARRARDRATALGNNDVLWRALVVEARAVRMLADGPAALALARESLATIERLKEAAIDRPGSPISYDTTSAYALLAVLQAAAGDVEGAFATAERRRAHALRVQLANNEREIHRGMTEAEREEERKVVAELVSLHARRDHERGLPKPDQARIAKIDDQIRDAAARRRATQQRLVDRLPDLARWRGLIVPDLPDRPPDFEGSITQFVVDEDDVLILHRPGATTEGDPVKRAHVVPITRNTLAERVAAALDAAALRTVDGWKKASAPVFSLMPAEVIAELSRAPRALFIPDDVLWRIPFEAMPVAKGWLADRTVVAYAGSLFALRARQPSGADAQLPYIAIGAPEIPLATRDRLKATAPGWSLRAPESSEREVQQIARLFGDPSAGATLLREAATERALRRDAPRASLVHVAAPFRINGASPLFSPVLLSAPASPQEASDDGVLETREVMNLAVGARLVTFSDGSAVSMRNAATAGPVIQWAWLAAGVPSVVLPRWTADQEPPLALLTDFYRRLREGAPSADALHAARAALRKNEATAAPFYWAGWLLFGG